MGDVWSRLKQTGLPALAVLPAFMWLACCCTFLQALALGLLLVGRRKEYYKVSCGLFTVLHRPLLYLFEYSSTRVMLHGSAAELSKTLALDQAVMLTNHRGNLDWLVGLQTLDFGGGVGCAKAIVKQSLLAVPLFGFIWWCVDYVFLSRSWAKDSATLSRGYKHQLQYRECGVPYTLAIFPEGTRMTEDKLRDAQAFARQKGLPVLEHALYPRVKGVRSALNSLNLDSIYDCTLVDKTGGKANILTLARGLPTELHVYVERLTPQSVPTDEAGFTEWLYKRWEVKDGYLRTFLAEGGPLGPVKCQPVEMKVRTSAGGILLGSVIWWLFCVIGFARWCLHTGRVGLLGGSFLGSLLLLVAAGFVLDKVHFEKGKAAGHAASSGSGAAAAAKKAS